MKKLLLALGFFAILFGFKLATTNLTYALGTCSCWNGGGASFICDIVYEPLNDCEPGYYANCPSGVACSQNPQCTCESISGNPDCGDLGQACCPNDTCSAGLTCWSLYNQPGTCQNTCQNNNDCPSGQTCLFEVCTTGPPPPAPPPASEPAPRPFCEGGDGYIDTAIGCIPYSTNEEFVGFLFKWGVGIAGGVAFLLIVYSGFIIASSKGNPERLKGGQELLTAAISGLILLVFSIFLLELIGVRILNLPGFGLD